MEEITYKQIHEEVDEFLRLVGDRTFNVRKIDSQYNYGSRQAKRYRWQILDEYVKSKKLERLDVDKFRLFDDELKEVDWQGADVTHLIELEYPLGIEKYVKTYHGSVAVVAGTPGSGKTAFMEHFVLKNMYHPMGVSMFNNDMSPEEIKERMINAGIHIPTPPPFRIYDRDCNFADVVKPDGINVIDYLDLNSDLYMIGDEIEKIYRRVKEGGGFALIGIQKKPNQDIAIGGIFTWKRPKLYFSMDIVRDGSEICHKLKIVKARGRINPKVNPNGMEWKFKLIGGIKFWVVEYG